MYRTAHFVLSIKIVYRAENKDIYILFYTMHQVMYETRIFERINDDGQKVRVTQKIKRTKRLSILPKFGDALSVVVSPIVEDDTPLVLGYGPKEVKIEKVLTPEHVTCRLCQGIHFTYKCPNKEIFNPTPIEVKAGTYVPPNRRSGSVFPQKEQRQSLRVDNISQDTTEAGFKDLFGRFGSISHIYFPLYENSQYSKGFAFVSFYDKVNSERCIQTLNGFKYDSLVLSVEWSKPKPEK